MPGRDIAIALLALMLALVGCARSRNHEQATYAQVDGRYAVTLSGTRPLMVHDPVSLVLGKTYEEHLRLDLPRLDGTIRGDEIPVSPGHYRYTGSVEVSGTRLRVDLYYDKDVREPLSWNGEYVLAGSDPPP